MIITHRLACFFSCLLLLATLVGAQNPPSEPSPEEVAEAPQALQASQTPRSSRQRLVQKSWWNAPAKVEALQLSESQRAEMDALMLRFLESRAEAIENQKEAFRAFGEALAEGEPATIRQRGEAVSQAMATPQNGQVELMIAVTALLTDKQRRELTTRYPKLLSGLWIRSGQGSRLMRGAGGRGRQN